MFLEASFLLFLALIHQQEVIDDKFFLQVLSIFSLELCANFFLRLVMTNENRVSVGLNLKYLEKQAI